MKRKRFVPDLDTHRILERTCRLLGDTRSVEEIVSETKIMFGYTSDGLNTVICSLENGLDGYWGENDYGPVYVTREKLIEQVKQSAEEEGIHL